MKNHTIHFISNLIIYFVHIFLYSIVLLFFLMCIIVVMLLYVFAVGSSLLGLQRVCGSGRGIHPSDANRWAVFVLVPLCGSLWCKASL